MTYAFKTNSKKVMGDLHTPVSIYLKVRDIYPESALLESSDFHGNENSLSFIALRPLASVSVNNGICTAIFPDGKREETPLSDSYGVAKAMDAFIHRFHIEGDDKETCGLFGYTAFDAVRYFEPVPVMEAVSAPTASRQRCSSYPSPSLPIRPMEMTWAPSERRLLVMVPPQPAYIRLSWTW